MYFENEFQRLAHLVKLLTLKKFENQLRNFATCGWTVAAGRQRVASWWNDNADITVDKKIFNFETNWKKWGVKEAYLEPKRAAKQVLYVIIRVVKIREIWRCVKTEE